MRAINHKLWRDLWRVKGQAFAIILVIASGIATFIMLKSTIDSLDLAQKRFYRDYRFADIFASLKRAPENLKDPIASIPGVNHVETRVVADVKLRIEGFDEPVTAKLVSVPECGEPILNRIFIRKGRMVEPLKDDEAVVSEAFADAHHFAPGDKLGVVINGKWKTLTLVGIALCPEYVLPVRPGAIMPDFKRYAILWMGRHALATAYNMEGAFNDVAVTVSPEARLSDVLARLDDLLVPYGGFGSYARTNQISHRFLSEEFKSLRTSAKIFPVIFIGVAAFLLYVVIGRTVSTQREQIAALKAFGYGTINIALHYAEIVLLISLGGVVLGTLIGVWFGRSLGNVYIEFYRFPSFVYDLRISVVITAVLISIGSSLMATLNAVWKASKLPPAEAMQPEAPIRYRKSVLERTRFWGMFSQSTRIIIRNIERRPMRSLFSILGISLSCSAMIASTFSMDAIDFMIDLQYKRSQKEDMTITFVEPTSRKAIHELQGLKGVEHAEAFRAVPVRLRFRQRSYETSIQGIEQDTHLRLLLDAGFKQVAIPPHGILLTDYLGNLLGVKPGDMLTVEVLEGSRPLREVPVVGLFEQFIGVSGYMNLDALNRLMKEDRAVSGAYLSVDPLHRTDLYRRFMEMPRVAGATVREDEIRSFYETQAEMFLFFIFIAAVLAATIAFGVVYNNARISLSERSRELASLRVLGYTRMEISFIFLGELAVLTFVAIPIGFLIGRAMSVYISQAMGSDLFRIPVLIERGTYSLAAAVVLASACLSGIIVRRRLDRLDLVAALKIKE